MAESPARSRRHPLARLAVFATACAAAVALALTPEGIAPAMRDAMNRWFDPRFVLPAAVVLLILLAWLPRAAASRTVFASFLVLTGGFFAFSMRDAEFRERMGSADGSAVVLMLVCVAGFGWLALRRATMNDRRGEPLEAAESRERVLTWPDLVYIELLAAVGVLALLFLWSYLQSAPLESPADPTQTPNPAKAPWYFVGLQEMLVYFDPWIAGVVFPGAIVFGLAAIPYLDRNPAGAGYYCWHERRFAIATFLFGFLILWVLLILLGSFLRGSAWQFFGPYEPWSTQTAAAAPNVNLSGLIWNSAPASPLLREMPGIVLVAAWFVAVPHLLALTLLRDVHTQMGRARYWIMAALLMLMLLLPAKMILRWTLDLKYVVSIPEWALNI
jgi:hypothetical protein